MKSCHLLLLQMPFSDDYQADTHFPFQEDGLLCQLEAYALFEHGQEHVHAAQGEARGLTLRIAVDGGADQCLRLDEKRTYTLDGRSDGYTAHAFVVLAQ